MHSTTNYPLSGVHLISWFRPRFYYLNNVLHCFKRCLHNDRIDLFTLEKPKLPFTMNNLITLSAVIDRPTLGLPMTFACSCPVRWISKRQEMSDTVSLQKFERRIAAFLELLLFYLTTVGVSADLIYETIDDRLAPAVPLPPFSFRLVLRLDFLVMPIQSGFRIRRSIYCKPAVHNSAVTARGRRYPGPLFSDNSTLWSSVLAMALATSLP